MLVDSSKGNNGERLLNARYQLISVVGGGGMAQVYKARDTILGRIVAVKLLREQYASDAQFVARFKREAQAAANLSHPNIVSVYDVGQDGDLYYIVMEYISGDSLKALINRSAPLPNDTATQIAIQILSGLEFAHRSGLIHRDIKPQNVLMAGDGTVKVTDFGIAKSVSDLGLTEAGIALGTAHYFSPEQARGERVVPQSDLYAVGVTLYEMLTGKLPFESDSAMGLAFKHISEAPRPPRQLNPAVPPKLEAIVMKALSKDPNERFTSASDMEKALRSVQAGGQQPTLEVPVAQMNVGGGRGRPAPPTATTRGLRAGSPGATPTSNLRRDGTSIGRTAAAYPAGGVAASAAARHMTSPLGAPASVSLPPGSRAAGGGSTCSTVAVSFLVLGVLALLVVLAAWFGPQLPALFSNPVIASPTPTPIIPTATPTFTPVPPTDTPTSTATVTPTATATPRSVAVPKLVGLNVQDAATLAKQSGFVLLELDRIESPQWPEGVVAQQDPQPNAILKQTSQIAVRVSKGPPPFKLPNLANTDPNDAKSALESAGLKVQLTYAGSTEVQKGVVIGTSPPSDSTVRPGDTIQIIVSRGETAEAPDLRGIENADLARQRLEAVGLTLGSVTEVADPAGTVPPGAVLSQDPPKGTILERGAPVNIQISKK